MASVDGAHTAFWTRRELINGEVLSGGMDGPTFRVPCARLLIDKCCQFEPRSYSADVCKTRDVWDVLVLYISVLCGLDSTDSTRLWAVGGVCLLACVFPLVQIYWTILHISLCFVSKKKSPFSVFVHYGFSHSFWLIFKSQHLSKLWARLSQQFHAASKLYCAFAKGSKTFHLHCKSVPP